MNHLVVSFNMSYASDLGIKPENALSNKANGITKFAPSESDFINANTIPGDRRGAWKKAIGLLTSFIAEKKPCLIGLQEINRWHKYSDMMTEPSVNGKLYTNGERPQMQDKRTFKDMKMDTPSLGYTIDSNEEEWQTNNGESWDAPRGAEAIVDMVRQFPEYDCFHDEVYGTDPSKAYIGSFSGMCIWNKTQFGNLEAAQVFSFDRQDTSRPILFVVTKLREDYSLFINIHGPNGPSEAEKMKSTIEKMVKNINDKFDVFKQGAGYNDVVFKNIFLTGDFNDRMGYLLKRVSKQKLDEGIKNTIYYGEFILGSTRLEFHSDNRPISCCFKEGNPPYKNIGDYVFSNKNGNLTVHQTTSNSDHKLVYFESDNIDSQEYEKDEEREYQQLHELRYLGGFRRRRKTKKRRSNRRRSNRRRWYSRR